MSTVWSPGHLGDVGGLDADVVGHPGTVLVVMEGNDTGTAGWPGMAASGGRDAAAPRLWSGRLRFRHWLAAIGHRHQPRHLDHGLERESATVGRLRVEADSGAGEARAALHPAAPGGIRRVRRSGLTLAHGIRGARPHNSCVASDLRSLATDAGHTRRAVASGTRPLKCMARHTPR